MSLFVISIWPAFAVLAKIFPSTESRSSFRSTVTIFYLWSLWCVGKLSSVALACPQTWVQSWPFCWDIIHDALHSFFKGIAINHQLLIPNHIIITDIVILFPHCCPIINQKISEFAVEPFILCVIFADSTCISDMSPFGLLVFGHLRKLRSWSCITYSFCVQ